MRVLDSLQTLEMLWQYIVTIVVSIQRILTIWEREGGTYSYKWVSALTHTCKGERENYQLFTIKFMLTGLTLYKSPIWTNITDDKNEWTSILSVHSYSDRIMRVW